MEKQINCDLEYWNCECDVRYIHPTSCLQCSVCGATQEEQPNSCMNEVRLAMKVDTNMFHTCSRP